MPVGQNVNNGGGAAKEINRIGFTVLFNGWNSTLQEWDAALQRTGSPATQGLPIIAGRKAKMDRHRGLEPRTCDNGFTGSILLS